MSFPGNNLKIEQARISMAPVDLTVNFNQGDMAKWDSVNKVVKPVAAPADFASFIGVFGDTNPIPSLNEKKATPFTNLITRGMFEFIADDTQTYFPGDYVTIGSDPQKVTKVGASAGNAVGVVAAENRFVVTAGAAVGIVAVAGVTKLLIYVKPQISLLSSL